MDGTTPAKLIQKYQKKKDEFEAGSSPPGVSSGPGQDDADCCSSFARVVAEAQQASQSIRGFQILRSEEKGRGGGEGKLGLHQ